MQVEIWSDIVCPWCYLGKHRFERALATFPHRDEVEVTYRAFELDPDAPVGETTPTAERLAIKYRMSPEQVLSAQQEMEARAAGDGLEFHMDGLESGNTRDAHRLLHLARAHDLGADLSERLHRAYFTEGRSIFDHASLAQIADEAGLDRADADRVLATKTYLDDVVLEEETARSLGVNGVPFFVIDRRYGISGAQSPEVITDALEQAWAETANA